MQIDKYRLAGSMLTIDYSAGSEGYGLSTLDEPEQSLLDAAEMVADRALEACGIAVAATPYSVSWGRGEHPGARVVVEIKCIEGDKPARLALPIISARVLEDSDGEPEDCAHNRFLEALALLESELEAFIEGKRKQMSLFDADEIATRRAVGE